MLHVLLVPYDLQESGDGAVVGQKAEPAAGREHTGNACDGALRIVDVLQHVDGEHEVESRFEAGAAQLLGRAAAIVDRKPRAPRVLPRRRKRPLRRVDAGHGRPLSGEGLGQDAATAPHVEGTLASESPEDPSEVFDPQRVQLVQPSEGAGIAPPHAGDPLHQALVFLGLGEAAEARELVGHERNLRRRGGWWRMEEVGGGWWRWLPSEGSVKLPREESGAALAVVEGRPILVG